jgi:hypothetical protein
MDKELLDQLSKLQDCYSQMSNRGKEYHNSFYLMPIPTLQFLINSWLDYVIKKQGPREVQIGLGLAIVAGLEILKKKQQS